MGIPSCARWASADLVIQLWFEEFALEDTHLCMGDFWSISVPEGEKVRLTFTSFDLVPDLCGDYVEVFDGLKAGAARLGEQHSPPPTTKNGESGTEDDRKLPKPLESSGSTMALRFRTDAALTSKGFSATTPSPACPRYPAELHCSWSIRAPRGLLVKLQVTDMAIPGELGLCKQDTLTVADSYRTLGTYCGYTLPPVLVSAGDNMVVKFQSDSRLTDRGFSAKWHAVYPEDIPESGVIKSPNWPMNYGPNGDCLWSVEVPEGKVITLTFSHFDVEARTILSPRCLDYVVMHDIRGTDGILVKKYGPFCGSKLPASIQTKGNRLVMRFTSDLMTEGSGFRAYWFTNASLPAPTEPPTPPNPWDDIPIDWPVTCGRPAIPPAVNARIVNGEPATPNSWPWQVSMQWSISVPEGEKVRLTFTSFDLVPDLCGDYVEVFDGLKAGAARLGKLCGGRKLPKPLESSGSTMALRFRTDAALTSKGFSATYTKSSLPPVVIPTTVRPTTLWPSSTHAPPTTTPMDSGCGGPSLLYGRKGEIRSLGFPSSYPAELHCSWSIRAPRGLLVKLQVTDMAIPGELGLCKQDTLTVADSYRTLGTYCGYTLPPVLVSAGDNMVVKFQSDSRLTDRGFSAKWHAVYPEDIPGSPGAPPTGPMNYGPNGDCLWSVEVPEGKVITLTFSHFDVEARTILSPRCLDYVVMHDIRRHRRHPGYADELNRWRMCLGKHNLTYVEPSERCFGVAGIYRHEGFRYPTVPTVEFDIALVRLAGDAVESPEVSYACLPSPGEVLPGKKTCYATGWGDETGDSLNATVAESLNQVALPVVPYNTCKRADYWWFQVKTSMICCGYTRPDELKSVCQGDSGGPLVCQDTAASPWEVHGITSFGPIGCIMDKKPSVFTRSSAYIPWIHNVMRRDTYNIYSTASPPSSTSSSSSRAVRLHFHQLSLEESTLCLNDKLSVTDRLGSLGTFCSHSAPQDLVSYDRELNISFSSNGRVVDTGFLATWTPVEPAQAPCGGLFHTAQGELTSPGWPTGDYPLQAACTWRLDVPATATAIHVVFTHFELQAVNQLGKCVDYVEVFEGHTLASLGRFCGFSPPSFTVRGNSAIVRFLSNGANQQSGFRGYWTTDASVVPTLPPPLANPWDNITIGWPEECGSPAVPPSNATLRVVNGVEAVPHSWPWQVSMQASPVALIPYMHGCGGSLIHQEWHHMNSSRDVPSAEACYPVDGILRHPGFVYEHDRSDISNDVALVHLAQPANLTREVGPVCLPLPGVVPPAGTLCYVSEQLNQAALPVVDFQTCSKPAYWWDVLRPSMICAGYESPDELKTGSYNPGAANSTWEVHGIVSFGAQGCIRDKKPSVFTRVSAFSGWIEDSIRKFVYEREPRPPHHKAAVQVKGGHEKDGAAPHAEAAATPPSSTATTTTTPTPPPPPPPGKFGVPLTELCALGLVTEEDGVPLVVRRDGGAPTLSM
ncbi:hypothetical protein CRUP_031615, partial [Coryphaenoides rupestris]